VVSQELVTTGAATGSDPYRTIIEHLKSVVGARLESFVGLRDLPGVLREWAGSAPDRIARVGRVISDERLLKRTALVMVALVHESVPVGDLDRILDVIVAEDTIKLSTDELLQRVRLVLHDVIPGADGSRQLLDLPEGFERTLASGLVSDESGRFVVLPGPVIYQLVQALAPSIGNRDPQKHAVIVQLPELRRTVRRLVEGSWPQLAVIARQELTNPPTSSTGRVDLVERKQ
jgi:flagellar biosynthesis component FlhA